MLKIKCDDCREEIPKKFVLKSVFTKEMVVACPKCKNKYKVTEKSVWIMLILIIIVPVFSSSILNNIFDVDILTYFIVNSLILGIMVICSMYLVNFKKIS